ncbi:MAG: ribosome assembly RNA-binding protein YhbY [Myxococcales bacterium]|nr:ribosome assembly RNA-binding protein YhbY [Myxococcales bacterium]
MGAPLVLTGKQKRHLRALGHHLDALVQLGKSGLTSGAIRAIDSALGAHELVKIKLGTECPDERDDVATRLAPEVSASVAQTMGRTILLYRRHPKKPVIVLPSSEAPKKKPATK